MSYEVLRCFRLSNGPRTGLTFLQSSVIVLNFFKNGALPLKTCAFICRKLRKDSHASVTPPILYAAHSYLMLTQSVCKFGMRHKPCGECTTYTVVLCVAVKNMGLSQESVKNFERILKLWTDTNWHVWRSKL